MICTPGASAEPDFREWRIKMKTDNQLQHDVLEELKFTPEIDHSHIGVTVTSGVVTLMGSVPNYLQKITAEHAAARVKGVHAIAEEIEVRFANDPKTSDTEIAERIVSMIRWDVSLAADNIQVKVEHGWVTLSGTVDWKFQHDAAKAAAARISGVKGVSNNITVKPRPTAYDVRETIVAALKRSAALDANTINVSVDGGAVKLRGEVHGWNERRVAERAAWSIPGVTRVEDEIVFA